MKTKNLLEYLKFKKNTNAYNNKYGFDLFITILLLGGLLSGNFYLYLKNSKKYLKNNWKNERCKPYVIPFAGYIHSDEKDIFLYTTENFTYCLHGILKGSIGGAFAPLTIVIQSSLTLLNDIAGKLEPIRGFFSGLLANFDNFMKIINIIILRIVSAVLKIFNHVNKLITISSNIINYNFSIIINSFEAATIRLREIVDTYWKVSWGILALVIFIIVMSIKIFITSSVMMTLGLALGPFGAMIFSMGTFILAHSKIMGVIAAFMSKLVVIWMVILGSFQWVMSDLKTPTQALQSYSEFNDVCSDENEGKYGPCDTCFDKDTILKTIKGEKKMSNIKIGDIFKDGSIITGKFKMKYNKDTIYKIGNILVTEEHPILYKNNWIRVDQHPDSEIVTNYKEKYIYCINTTDKKIKIDNYIFQDWDELDKNDIEELKNIANINNIIDINLKLEHGFHKNTKIKLLDNTSKNIVDIKPGDILLNNNKVLGVATLNGKKNKTINEYLINNKKIICTSNTIKHIKGKKEIINKNIKVNKLYSLITSKKNINIDDIIFNDYNYGIEKFIK